MVIFGYIDECLDREMWRHGRDAIMVFCSITHCGIVGLNQECVVLKEECSSLLLFFPFAAF